MPSRLLWGLPSGRFVPQTEQRQNEPQSTT